MNSKKLSNYSSVFLLISAAGIIYEIISGDIINGVFPMILISAIYGVGSALMKKLEQLNKG